jgi:glycosyltransferase involved in cell wall biosynthesis
VVATAVGGTAEIAQANPALHLLPSEAAAQQFAEALADLAQKMPERATPSPEPPFHASSMLTRYAQLYPRAIEAARGRRRGEGLLVICNNFVTGGAQSSARRLLTGLAAQGVRARAAILEEAPGNPTPGRQALLAAGIPVRVLPPAGTIAPADAVARLLEWIDEDPPEAVLFWNALMEYKIRVADGLFDIPVYDVSPGEMFFDSLERYFARPRPDLPYRTGIDYGKQLAGVIVKFCAEAEQAARLLGAPVTVIPNGVPLDGSVARRAPGERLVIGTSARLSPQKKLEDLLAALQLARPRLPPYVLRIAGRVERGCGPYAEMLRSQGAGLSVDWVGEQQDIGQFLGDLDLFVLVAEPGGCPNASLEAMAAALPLICTDVGGASEQVDDGITGRLVPRGDIRALADALVELAQQPQLRARFAAAGRATVAARFDVKRMIADYRRVCLPSGQDAEAAFLAACR